MKTVAPDIQTVVVDNNSQDSTLARARAEGADVVLPSRGNQGFGRACNVGAASCSSRWLLFANPDVALRACDFYPGRSALTGIGACYVADADETPKPDVGAETTQVEDLLLNVLGPFLPSSVSRLLFMRRVPRRWVSGALFLVPREDFLRIGGFDRRLFLYYEDRDLARRARHSGIPVRDVPTIRGSHAGGGSTSETNLALIAWRVAGWIEYVGIWGGQQKAERAARQVVAGMKAILRVLPHLPATRAPNKVEEFSFVLGHLLHIEDRLPITDPTLLPHARRALAVTFRDR